MSKTILRTVGLLALLASLQGPVGAFAQSASAADSGSLDSATRHDLLALYKKLIDAENAHDIAAVKLFVWKSPSMLFVAKTKTAAEGNWAGFWGSDVALQHLSDFYKQTFRIDPDYSKEKVVALSSSVAETYAPVRIAVAYGGQSGLPKPFLMILEWVKTSTGWKMATDIALPIPPAPGAKA
jgi:hypothetical protein